jgi:uncharacterized membrane protein YgcG
MTIRHFSLLFVVMAGLAFAPPVDGQLLEEYGRCFQRVNKWPDPWICPDRQSVRAPMAIMAANGWRRQNMLTDLHFTDTNDLTEAGDLLVRWILNEAPQARRVIYVHRGTTGEDTAARMAVVAKAAQRAAPSQPIPPILETSISDVGWPAREVEIISRRYDATIPDPRLPKDSGGGGGGGGGGGAPGGGGGAGGGGAGGPSGSGS